MILIDGKKLSEEVLFDVSKRVRKNNLKVCLAIILVGSNDASEVYVRNKIKSCEKVGITAKLFRLDSSSEEKVIELIKKLNEDGFVHGIILQSPLPNNMNFNKCVSHILASKDVDGLSKDNIYKNYMNEECMLPCTVSGVLKILKEENIEINKKNICIIGRSNLVGKPLFHALENRGATVSLCHSKTAFLGDFTENADIIIMACGVANLLKDYMIKNEAVIIDVGINRVDGKLCGDADFESVSKKCSYITPVPGGVGPMTVASVIENTLICYENLNK